MFANKICLHVLLYLDEAGTIDQVIHSQMQKCGVGLWVCVTCGWETKYKTRLYEHVEAKHMETGGRFCPICQKTCPSKNALASHVSRNHRKIK